MEKLLREWCDRLIELQITEKMKKNYMEGFYVPPAEEFTEDAVMPYVL